LTALCAAALCSALPARGDDLQDASKFLKAGQHSQALERVNKVLKASRAIPGPLSQGHHRHRTGQ